MGVMPPLPGLASKPSRLPHAPAPFPLLLASCGDSGRPLQPGGGTDTGGKEPRSLETVEVDLPSCQH